jgi:hypothetical protein
LTLTEQLPQVVNLANSLATLDSSRRSSLNMRNHNSNHSMCSHSANADQI